MKCRKTLFRILPGIAVGALLLGVFFLHAHAVSLFPGTQCREDRALVRTGAEVLLVCVDSSGKAVAGGIMPVYREHRYGQGESAVFHSGSPNRIREVGKVQVIGQESASAFRSVVLEGPLHTGDIAKSAALNCVICSVVCDNTTNGKEKR